MLFEDTNFTWRTFIFWETVCMAENIDKFDLGWVGRLLQDVIFVWFYGVKTIQNLGNYLPRKQMNPELSNGYFVGFFSKYFKTKMSTTSDYHPAAIKFNGLPLSVSVCTMTRASAVDSVWVPWWWGLGPRVGLTVTLILCDRRKLYY